MCVRDRTKTTNLVRDTVRICQTHPRLPTPTRPTASPASKTDARPPPVVVTGTLCRYAQMGEMFAGIAEHVLPLTALNELCFGSLENLPGGRLKESFPEEYQAREADKLKAKEIAHRLKTKHGTNHLAVVDRKIQQLKTLLVNEMIENSKQGDPLPVWNTFLESVTAGINAAPTAPLLGESPNSVKDVKEGEIGRAHV